MDPNDCVAAADRSPLATHFRHRLLSEILSRVKRLGLPSDRKPRRFEHLGILAFERDTTSDVEMAAEEERRVRAGEIEAPQAA